MQSTRTSPKALSERRRRKKDEGKLGAEKTSKGKNQKSGKTKSKNTTRDDDKKRTKEDKTSILALPSKAKEKKEKKELTSGTTTTDSGSAEKKKDEVSTMKTSKTPPPNASKPDKSIRKKKDKEQAKMKALTELMAVEVNKTKLTTTMQEAYDDFITAVTGKGLRAFREQFPCITKYGVNPPSMTTFQANVPRNRNPEVPCLEATRVVLAVEHPNETDYIHANWVRHEDLDRPIIAAQAPIKNATVNTIVDYWRMVYEHQICIIVSIICPGEDCPEFYPTKPGESVTYGNMFVMCKSADKGESEFMVYMLEVLPEGCSNSNIIKLVHYKEWKEGTKPRSIKSILRLLRFLNRLDDLHLHGVLLVQGLHGTGRTGTLIFIKLLIAMLFRGRKIDPMRALEWLRGQRAFAVDNAEQAAFAIRTTYDLLRLTQDKYKAMELREEPSVAYTVTEPQSETNN